MTHRAMQIISQLDQANAAVADVFKNLTQNDLAVVRQIRNRIDRQANEVQDPSHRCAFRAAGMAIGRALCELEVMGELADVE